jgi:hypothetical protein
MKHNTSHGTFRLHISNRHDLKDIGIAASALIAAGVFSIAAGSTLLADGEPVATAATAPPLASERDRLWDRIHLTGLPEATVESAAADAGLVSRGSWISFDGLTWEHIDGRVVVVANPRRAASPDAGRDADVIDGTSRA